MAEDILNKVALINNYNSSFEMVVKHIMPYSTLALIVGTIIVAVFSLLWTGLIIMLLGLAYGIGYPFIKYLMLKRNIERHLTLFITYAGTISTMKISTLVLFKRVSEKKVFGEIGNIFEKVLYLAKSWNLGYALSCRKVAESCPSKIMSDFLDRLSVSLEMGQEIDKFLMDEQEAVMNEFATEYKNHLELLKVLQEVYISFSISGALIIGIVLLGPLLADFAMGDLMMKTLYGFIIVDVILIITIYFNSIYDPIYAELKYENELQKLLRYVMFGCFGLGFAIFIVLLNTTKISFMFNVAISVVPLIIPSFLYTEEEKRLRNVDNNFPVYIRAIGSSINIRRGAVASALKATQVHDFGILNQPSINLYKRLKLGNEKFKCWQLFGSELGSYLGFHFSRIFSQAIYLGGNPQKIGDMVSKNIQEILSLRKMKYQTKDGIKHSFYGSLIGLSATMYVSAKISEILISAFSSQVNESDEMSSFITAILPNTSIDFDVVFVIIGIILLTHILAMGIILAIIHGTNISSYYFDMVIMIWLCAFLSWAVPLFVGNMIPNINIVPPS